MRPLAIFERRTRANAPSSGFTLLELLLAIGLTSALMAAVFSALQMSFDIQSKANEDIERQQVARALLRQMARDIQSVVFVKKALVDEETSSSTSSGTGSGTGTGTKTSGGSGTGTGGTGTGGAGTGGTGASGSGTGNSGNNSGSGTGGSGVSGSGTGGTDSSSGTGSSGTGNSADSAALDAVMKTYTNGIVGTESDLQLFISRPDRDLDYLPSEEITSTSERSSDLLFIRYLMADQNGGGLAAAIAKSEGAERSDGPLGLARLEGDLFGLRTAIESNEEMPQVDAAELKAEEVSKIVFRYFDGAEWQETWDSTALNQLPKAIEIVLTLRRVPSETDSDEDDQVDPYAMPDSTHRMVVPLPVCEPFVAGETL